jgi:hypothetical protein
MPPPVQQAKKTNAFYQRPLDVWTAHPEKRTETDSEKAETFLETLERTLFNIHRSNVSYPKSQLE